MKIKALAFDTGGTILDWHGGLADVADAERVCLVTCHGEVLAATVAARTMPRRRGRRRGMVQAGSMPQSLGLAAGAQDERINSLDRGCIARRAGLACW
jgi:FMN phosphatase YigB (HAD superfamily)